MRLANAGARALISYITRTESAQRDQSLTARYRAARRREIAVNRRVNALRDKPGRAAALQAAFVDAELARLELESIRGQIRTATEGAGDRSSLQLLVPADDASSDRNEKLQQLLLIGGGAGLVLGFALALLVANRRLLRRSKK